MIAETGSDDACDSDEEKGRKATSERKLNSNIPMSTCQPINDTCVICLEEFSPGQQIKLLPCKHGFHGECIDPWLSERSDQVCVCV